MHVFHSMYKLETKNKTWQQCDQTMQSLRWKRSSNKFTSSTIKRMRTAKASETIVGAINNIRIVVHGKITGLSE